MLSRRSFLYSSCSAVAAVSIALPSEVAHPVPNDLDHILLGSSDLQKGIDFVEQNTGVRATFGGVHPGRCTQNALLSLGERRYLEIIAPDPKQGLPDVSAPTYGATVYMLSRLKALLEPRLIGWAAHPGDIAKFAQKLRQSDVPFAGPWPGSRKRPDGSTLKWQTLALNDDESSLLPFFIEWSADTVHPSADAPKGCTLVRFAAETPDPPKLNAILQKLSLDLPVSKSDKAQLRATIHGLSREFVCAS